MNIDNTEIYVYELVPDPRICLDRKELNHIIT